MSGFIPNIVTYLNHTAKKLSPPRQQTTYSSQDLKFSTEYPSSITKTYHWIKMSSIFTARICILPLILCYYGYKSLINRALPLKASEPLDMETTQKVLQGSLEHFGVSDSLFQSCLRGVPEIARPIPDAKEGRCQWADSIENATEKYYEGCTSKEDINKKCAADHLIEPLPFIQVLKDMGANSYRFSIEWADIAPEEDTFDENAIACYRNFINELVKAGITPFVTLHHFTHPQWFEKKGGFAKEENIHHFVTYAEKMVEAFLHVTHWMTFNEPNVFAFQGYVRGKYPPFEENIRKSAKVLKHLFMAHIETYKKLKTTYGDSKEIGITYQWLKFTPFSNNNPLEISICYWLNKITHQASKFFKSKQLRLKLPFLTNIELTLPKEEKICDFLGFQGYGSPQVGALFFNKENYPEDLAQNISLFGKTILTIGSISKKEDKIESFGMVVDVESVGEALREACSCNLPVYITETGCDHKTWNFTKKAFQDDPKTQKEYFTKLFPLIARINQEFNNRIKALFIWTWRGDHLEWDKGRESSLGVSTIIKEKDEHGYYVMKEYHPRAAFYCIKDFFTSLMQIPQQEAS